MTAPSIPISDRWRSIRRSSTSRRSRPSSRRSGHSSSRARNFNNFGRGGANDSWGFNRAEPLLFYSRRIGRPPQGRPRGISSITHRDDDPRRSEGDRQDQAWLEPRHARRGDGGNGRAVTGTSAATEVEPLSNYLVGRAERADVAPPSARSDGNPSQGDGAWRRSPRPVVCRGADGYFFFDGRMGDQGPDRGRKLSAAPAS